MTHEVWKTAGRLGPTRQDVEEAAEEGAAVGLPIGFASLAALGGLKLQEIADRRKSLEEVGPLPDFLRNIYQTQPELELKRRLQIIRTGLINDPIQMGYAAEPVSGSLYVPWGGKGRPNVFTQYDELLDLAATPAEIPLDKPAERGAEAIQGLRKRTWLQRLREEFPQVPLSELPYSPTTVAHELGHLSRQGSRFNKALGLGYMIGPMLGTALGGAAAFDEDPTLAAAAPAIVAVGHTPQLMEEARASLAARRIMKKLVERGDVPAPHLRKIYRMLGPAFGTYLAGAAIPTLGVAAIAKAMQEKHERGTVGDVWAHGKQILQDVGQYTSSAGAEAVGDAMQLANF